jgi:hypothetical protein
MVAHGPIGMCQTAEAIRKALDRDKRSARKMIKSTFELVQDLNLKCGRKGIANSNLSNPLPFVLRRSRPNLDQTEEFVRGRKRRLPFVGESFRRCPMGLGAPGQFLWAAFEGGGLPIIFPSSFNFFLKDL